MPLRWNASMVGELGHWDYFKNTMRQLGTVPKVMLENSTHIEPTDCDTGSCSSRQCAIFSFNEKDLAPTRHSSIQRWLNGENDTDRGKFSIFNMPYLPTNFPSIIKMRMSELAIINLPVWSTRLVTRARMLFACMIEWVQLRVKKFVYRDLAYE